VESLLLQQVRGLTALATGVVFLPMMLIGAALTPFSARIAERLGARSVITGGLILMTGGLAALALVPEHAPVWLLAGSGALVRSRATRPPSRPTVTRSRSRATTPSASARASSSCR